jgi:hypothetical protein
MTVVAILIELFAAFSNGNIIIITAGCSYIKEVGSPFASPDALTVNAFHSFFIIVVRHC